MRAHWLAQNQMARFLVVGALNTLFGYALFSVLVLAGVAPGIALFAATVVGVLFNYFTTGRLVFAARGLGRVPWFLGVYGLTFLVNLWSLKGLTAGGLSPFLAQLVILPVVTALNFFLNKTLVFRATS